MEFLHSLPDYNFLGLEKKFTDFKNAKVAILPVPFGATASYQLGANFGPKAIIDASRFIELYDHEIDFHPSEVGICTLNELEPSVVADEMVKRVESAADEVLSHKKFLVTLGGDHAVAIGVFKAVAKHYKEFTILHFDAHQDLRQEYEGTPNSHACALARGFEQSKSLVQVGIRSTEKKQLEFAKKNGIKVVFAEEFNDKPIEKIVEEILPHLKQNVYISIDIDVLDPSEMPSTGTPEPNGLKFFQVMKVIRKVCEQKNLIGFDLVELMPTASKAPDFLAAKMAYKIIGYKFNPRK